MQILLDGIGLVLMILIKIGDVVLFIGRLLKKGLKKLIAIGKFPYAILAKKVRNFFALKARLAFEGVAQKNSKKEKLFIKHEKIKPIVIFPLPFLIRFKYFFAGSAFSFLFIFIPLLFFIYLQDLPNPHSLSLALSPQTTKIYDRDGRLLYQIYANQNRTLVTLDAIPISLKRATIAIEDKDFYKHPGFDISAIIRSIISNLSGGQLQGGSTITQQLIKSALLTPETSVSRKVKEIIIAIWAEHIYNKDQILEMYFNQVPYGGTAWGIEAAAEIYFGKPVQKLTLSESAFLAGIPRAPSLYSPFGTTPSLWKKRQAEVLERMAKLGFISSEQSKAAENEKLSFQPQQIPIHAPYFVMYVRDVLVKKYGLPMVEKGGLSVTTSLDSKLNDKASQIVSDEVKNSTYLNVTNGASLITNPSNGDILAMIGGKDFSDPISGNVNLTTSLRQPGSSIKIVTYAAALSKGFTAATILDDSPVTYSAAGSTPYSPVNYDGRFHGKIPLRFAFANSFNIPAVKTLNKIGVQTMLALGKEMGIKSWGDSSKYGLSITLGGAEVTMLDMSTVYATVANGGIRVDPNPILKVTDYKGNILEEKTVFKRRIIDEGVAFILSDILSDNAARSLEFGPNSPLVIPGHTVSVKTGTSDNKRDNWTTGFTKDYVVTVWVGNNDNSPMNPQLASGITGAAPIWNKIMSHLLEGIQNKKPSTPQNIVQKQCGGHAEYFIKGTENISCNFSFSPNISPTKRP